jgi:hypothetical protein
MFIAISFRRASYAILRVAHSWSIDQSVIEIAILDGSHQ